VIFDGLTYFTLNPGVRKVTENVTKPLFGDSPDLVGHNYQTESRNLQRQGVKRKLKRISDTECVHKREKRLPKGCLFSFFTYPGVRKHPGEIR